MNELLLSWLNDAYAMENAIIKALEQQIDEMQPYPYVVPTLKHHLDQTRHHAELVKDAIEHRGGNVSNVKAELASITGMLQGHMTQPADDMLTKNFIMNYAVEHFEIGCYTSIIAAARAMGDEYTVRNAEEILTQEVATAHYVSEYLPAAVKWTLSQLVPMAVG